MQDSPRTSLLSLVWVQALALILATTVTFGAALEGELVWDDEEVIGPASALAGPQDAFRRDLFATGGTRGASYYRPLVTLSYWADVHLFPTAPHVGLHVVNLVWHAIAAVLLLSALRRWTGARPGSTAELASFAATLAWALLPMKAENVAWISGRGDVMGAAFALGGLEVAARTSTRRGRVAAVAIGTALAILCKEAMVGTVALVAGACLAEARATREATWREDARVALLDPRTLGSGAVAISYLALRSVTLPISSGGHAMFATVPPLQRGILFLETTAQAAHAFAMPWRSELLRGQIAFTAPGQLAPQPAWAFAGAAIWLLLAIAFARLPRARAPIVMAMGAFLPASNLIPTGLLSRVSERFLYLPSIGIFLGVAVAIASRPVARARLGAALVLAASVGLGVAAHRRSALFLHDDALFGWEARHGGDALPVLRNAALAAARHHRYREARDLELRRMERMHELGFKGEGYDSLIESTRHQTWATEDTFPEAQLAFVRLMRTLLAGGGDPVDFPFDDGRGFRIVTKSPESAAYVGLYELRLKASLARVLARRGDESALDLAREIKTECPRCRGSSVDVAQVALACARPDLAQEWLSDATAGERGLSEVRAAAEVEERLLTKGGAPGRALALLVGGAYRPACADALARRASLDRAARVALATACRLGAEPKAAEALLEGIAGVDPTTTAESLRFDWSGRAELALVGAGLPLP